MSDILIYNTLARRKQPLVPLKAGEVGMYVCGPTVYDDCHIGHLMGPVLFDAVARWLAARGFRVRFVNNITDIDDKIIKRALETGEAWDAITARYTAQYLSYLDRLQVRTVTDHPRCSAYIPQMIHYIEELIARDRAYRAADGVYYDVQRQEGYGKLSGRKLDEMLAGVRVERGSSLRHPADFALWKNAKPGEPSWDSPWGAGRPGWHIECSVMSHQTLGASFDIHGGGDDLKFPHHENEIAQSEAHGDGFARCWMHNGLIQYDGIKVGKSDPRMRDAAFARQFKADYLLDTFGAATVRFLLLQGHYRRPNDFAPASLTAARTALGRLHDQLGALLEETGSATLDGILTRPLAEGLVRYRHDFVSAMDDDFNTGAAIAALFGLIGEARKLDGEARHALLIMTRDLGRLIGLFLPGDAKDTHHAHATSGAALGGAMGLVLELRQAARANRQFALSDRIRDGLASSGITIKDAKDGASWQQEGEGDALPAVMALVLELRQQVRLAKDFAASDRIRDGLAKVGIAIKDAKDGATWSVMERPVS